jgi:hypothetical protein
LVPDGCDWEVAEQSVRDLEIKFGLVRIESSHLLDPTKRDSHRLAPTSAELGAARHGKPSARVQLQLAVDAALLDNPTFADFVGRLHADGVEVRPNIQSTGRIAGISFGLDGFSIKGSRLGKAYTWNALQKRGLNYEHERDGHHARECVRRCEALGDTTRNGSVADGNGSDPRRNPQNNRELVARDSAVCDVDLDNDRGNAEHAGGSYPGGARSPKWSSNDGGEFAPIPQKIRARSGDESGKANDRADVPQLGNRAAGDESLQLRVRDRSENPPVPPMAVGHGGIRGLAPADMRHYRPIASGAGRWPGGFVGSVSSDAWLVEVIDGSETADEALRKWGRNAARALRGLQRAGVAHSGNNDPTPPRLHSLFQSLDRLSALADKMAVNNGATSPEIYKRHKTANAHSRALTRQQ